MRIAMVGLGKMGLNMTRRLLRGGHEVVAVDRSANAVREAAREGALPAASVADAVAILSPPRVVWLMVPAGPPVDENVELLAGTLEAGDVVVDGGNSLYKEAPRRAKRLAERGVRFLDAGTSGGIWGLAEGDCLMVGGGGAGGGARGRPRYGRKGTHRRQGAGHDAVVRRGVRTFVIRPLFARPAGDCLPVEPGERRPVLASGTCRTGIGKRPWSLGALPVRGRFGGRALDGRAVHRGGSSSPVHRPFPLHEVLLPAGQFLRDADAGRSAQRVRGACGKDGVYPAEEGEA